MLHIYIYIYIYDISHLRVKAFGLKNLKLTVVARRCIAPDGGSVGEYRANQ